MQSAVYADYRHISVDLFPAAVLYYGRRLGNTAVQQRRKDRTMELVENIQGACKTYRGTNGEAILTKNFGNRDKGDRWSVTVVVSGEYKRLANMVEFSKGYAMAENVIG